MKKYNADAHICGHEHTYGRQEVEGVYQVLTGSSGAPLYNFNLTPESDADTAALHELTYEKATTYYDVLDYNYGPGKNSQRSEDFVVLRVFFTAMIVAMVGLLYFDYFGWLEMDKIFILPTYLSPMIVGSIIMGFGFIIGGYCPGTSYTGIAIGKLDALVFTIGLFLGIFLFSEAFPLFEDFYYSGDMGPATITDLLGISAQWIALAFVIIALAAFWITWIIEKRVRKNITPYKF